MENRPKISHESRRRDSLSSAESMMLPVQAILTI
jgi:hypothetical protein